MAKCRIASLEQSWETRTHGLVVPFELRKGDSVPREDPYLTRNRSEASYGAGSGKFTTEFEKPGFLRTAEEKVQDKTRSEQRKRVSKRMSQSKLVILSARGES